MVAYHVISFVAVVFVGKRSTDKVETSATPNQLKIYYKAFNYARGRSIEAGSGQN